MIIWKGRWPVIRNFPSTYELAWGMAMNPTSVSTGEGLTLGIVMDPASVSTKNLWWWRPRYELIANYA